ncbi:GGDEF domain-containing protein [Leptothrix discophora]|uniref:diguanylate cyclase n=1 Tax=Leptothrix discophora TaxID=89 RepID=A0ABT9FYQ8_LEPDI|nr:diguanylate cyclase [Leptothrix discophora]MDP4299365.1 diguanylate cyclase [Leptothrix discophora]
MKSSPSPAASSAPPAGPRRRARVAEPDTVSRVMHLLLFIGAAMILAVWAMELHEGVINPWDRWMQPLLALVVGGAAVLMVWRPTLDPVLRPLPVLSFNLYLIVTLHMTLLYGSGPQQWYQTLTALYWVPLAYGCGFVFLRQRMALLVCTFTATGIFLPMLVWWQRGQLPAWTHEHGPLLVIVAMSHVMYVLLLWAVIKLRDSHADARDSAERMRTLAATDVLTGLPNRRSMLDTLATALAESRRSGQPLTIALVDVDHFKAVNDQHGHAQGDAVLMQIGACMRAQLRAVDGLARWGGEEFLICATATPLAAAVELAERVRVAVSACPMPHGEQVTISLGLTPCEPGDDVDTLLQRADHALYEAKARGRNRSVTRTREQERSDAARPASMATQGLTTP